VTQRAGRAERLDEANLQKVALIVDVIDTFEGDFASEPMLYRDVVGQSTILVEDFHQQSHIREKELVERPRYNKSQRPPAALVEHIQQTHFEVLIKEEVIKEYVQKRRTPIRKKTNLDLSIKQLAQMTGIKPKEIESCFRCIQSEWQQFYQMPTHGPAPTIKVETVKTGNKLLLTIHHESIKAYLTQYFPDKLVLTEKHSDATPGKISEKLGLPIEMVNQGFDKLTIEWSHYFGDPVSHKKPPIRIIYVSSPRQKDQIQPAIPTIQLYYFGVHYLAKTTARPRQKDDMDWKNVMAATELGSFAAKRIFSQLISQWNNYSLDPANKTEPSIPISWVRDKNLVKPVISRSSLKSLTDSYYGGKKLLYDESDYLSSTEISAITGVGKLTISRTFDELEAKWKLKLPKNKRNDASRPPVKLNLIKKGKIVARCIQKSELLLLLKYIYGPDGFYKKQDSDLNGKEIAKLTGKKEYLILTLLRKIRKQWDDYESKKPGIVKPDFYVKTARNSSNQSMPVIDKKDLNLFKEKYLTPKVSKYDDASCLSTRDIIEITGVPPQLGHAAFKELVNDWGKFTDNPTSHKKPAVAIQIVKKKRNAVASIDRNDLETFKQKYLSQFMETNGKAKKFVTCKQLALHSKSSDVTMRKCLKVLQRQWQDHNKLGENKVSGPSIKIYTMWLTGKEMLCIEKKDIPTFLQEFFPNLETMPKSANELTTGDLFQLLDYIPQNAIKLAFSKFTKEWDYFLARPGEGAKPKLNLLKVRSSGHVTSAIDKKQFHLFVKTYLPDYTIPVSQESKRYFHVKQIAQITGIKLTLISEWCNQLDNQWKHFRRSGNPFKKPAIPLYLVQTKDKPVWAVEKIDLPSFIRIFHSKKSTREIVNIGKRIQKHLPDPHLSSPERRKK
jgi:hypothetical protein